MAILDFEYATVYSDVSAIFGQNVDVGKGITDLLVNYLVKDGSYSVIERKALDKILKEQNFSNSDRADSTLGGQDRQAARRRCHHRRQHDAVRQRHKEYRHRRRRRRARAKSASAASSQKQSKAIVGLNARIVNIDTGEIIGGRRRQG